MWWQCPQGHQWSAIVKSRTEGAGCPYCASRQVSAGFNDLAARFPHLAQEWHPEKNGRLTPRDVVPGSRRKVWWQCAKGHVWQVAIASRAVDGAGCPVCAGKQVAAGENDLATLFPHLAQQWDRARNGAMTPETVSPYSNRKAWWICALGHRWQATVSARAGGSDCPYCAGRKVLAGFNDLATKDPAGLQGAFRVKDKDLIRMLARSLDEKDPWVLLSRPVQWDDALLEQSFGERTSERRARKTSYILLGAAVLSGLVFLLFGGGLNGMAAAMTAMLCMGAPLSSTLVAGLATLRLQKSAAAAGAVIPGWAAIEELGGVVAYTGKAPFDTVCIHGIVRDSQGRKMSKSLGNGIDPLEVIAQYGADALRFMLVDGSTPGNDMRYIEKKVEAARNFANKLWNATRFVLMNLPEDFEPGLPSEDKLDMSDKWVLTKLNQVAGAMTDNLDHYEMGLAAAKINSFIWDVYCDWFIEIAKPRLNSGDAEQADTARRVLVYVLDKALKLLHPFMPFITEELYQALPYS